MSFVDICNLLWQNKWVLIGVTAVSVCLSLIYVFTAREWYRAEVLLKLADPKSTEGLSGQIGGLGGLAALAGLSVGSNSSAEPIAVLNSREFTNDFINEQNLLPILFPSKWDASAKRWKSNNIVDQPDIRDGFKYFDRTIRNVREDRKTGLVTLTIEWTDATVATEWANLLVERVNDLMRKRALKQAETNVNYLKQELAASTLVPLQQSIGRVLETELQKLMLANVSKEYAFRIIDHAQVPKWHTRPQRIVIVSAAFILGVLASTLFLVLRQLIRRNSDLSRVPTTAI